MKSIWKLVLVLEKKNQIIGPPFLSTQTADIKREGSLCTSQGPLSAITENNRGSMVLADCAKHCCFLTQEEAECLSRIKTRNLQQLLLFLSVVSLYESELKPGNEQDEGIMFG